MEKYYCDRCGEKLDPSKIVWLELDQDTGRYTDQPLPEGHESQGGFSFGRACAKAVLANGGTNIRIMKAKKVYR
jgi:hypothetical protein